MRLEEAIQAWGEKHGIWYDSSFANFLQHVDGEPSDHPVITISCTDGELGQVLDGSWNAQIQDEFHELVDSLGYECENQNGANYYFFAQDEELKTAFEAYFKWQWRCCGDAFFLKITRWKSASTFFPRNLSVFSD